jgi:hypothetical protein
MKTRRSSITKGLLVIITIVMLTSISCVAIADHAPTTGPAQTEPVQIEQTQVSPEAKEPSELTSVPPTSAPPTSAPLADATGTPLPPLATPQPSAGPELIGPLNTPIPLSERAITPENADQVGLLTLLESDWVRGIVWSLDGKWLVIAGNHVHFYDAQSLKEVYVLDSAGHRVLRRRQAVGSGKLGRTAHSAGQ